MSKYRDLVAWQKANRLAHEIYSLSEQFPSEERYGITSQIKRSALSVPTNIVEGYGRRSRLEFKRFLDIALGSLAETEYLLSFAIERGYCESSDQINKLVVENGKIIWSLRESIK